MHESLFNYVNKYSKVTLTDTDKDLIRKVFVPKKFRKKQYFLQEGEICKYTAFILKGSMRQYSVDEKGTEHIVQLYMEDWWAVDRESYLKSSPSAYNIDVWEDTDVLLLSKADSEILAKKIPAVAEIRLKMDESYAIAAQRRLHAAISYTAEKRYAEFSETYPAFIQRFPQHIIASYLGITKETLSRIRKITPKK